MQDGPHTGRTITTDDDRMKTLIGINRLMAPRYNVKTLIISNSIVYLHLQQLSSVNEQGSDFF